MSRGVAFGTRRWHARAALALAAVALTASLGAQASAALASRGFPDATLVRQSGDVELYRLGASGVFHYFALVRAIAPNEAILDYVDGTNQFGHSIKRYGARETARFRELIVPALDGVRGPLVTVTIYHYARGVSLARVGGDDGSASNSGHFATGQPIEPPVATELWDGQRRGDSPFTWLAGGASGITVSDAAAHNTIASLRATQATAVAAQRRIATTRDSLFAAEDADVQRRRAARLARDAERARAVQAAGLLFWSPDMWMRYRLGPEMQAVFDGRWPDAARAWEFGMLYARTIREFSVRCRALIPRGAPFQVTRRWERNSVSGSWQPSGGDTTFIPPAFIEPYRWWDTRAPRALPLVPPPLDARTVDDLLGTIVSAGATMGETMSATALLARVGFAMREDMATLFQHGCASQPVKQFMDNLRRLALGLPSGQAALVPLPAVREADRPMTIGAACRRSIESRGANVEQSVGREYCPCLERAAARTLTIGERWAVVEDYARFFDEVAAIRDASTPERTARHRALGAACVRR
jgi:hypothetical protein